MYICIEIHPYLYTYIYIAYTQSRSDRYTCVSPPLSSAALPYFSFLIKGPHTATPGQGEATSEHHHRRQHTRRRLGGWTPKDIEFNPNFRCPPLLLLLLVIGRPPRPTAPIRWHLLPTRAQMALLYLYPYLSIFISISIFIFICIYV